jgi:hypothetical protein
MSIKIVKFTIAKSTNPNTGEEVFKLRALTDSTDKKYKDILVFSPKLTAEELKAELVADPKEFVDSLNLVETSFGPVYMAGSRREVIWELAL